MKEKMYHLDPEAIIRSLHCALLEPHDHSQAIKRLTNTINRLPKESLQISRARDGVYFYSNRNHTYLRKNSSLLYSLARKKYCAALLKVLTLNAQLPVASVVVSNDSPDSLATTSPVDMAVARADGAASAQLNDVTSARADGAASARSTVAASVRPAIKTSARLDAATHAALCAKAFAKLEQLIRDFARGNLELERIVLTSQQYKWYRSHYKKKRLSPEQIALNLRIPQSDNVRTKSEQRIGYELDQFAVPCHYEERLTINVQKLVRILEAELRERNQLQWNLFSYQGYTCIWNVPPELEWMNAPGSIWRSYDDRTGCIRLHPDYTIMLADGSLLYWEHEGMIHQFFYRTNALERIEVIHQAGGVPKTRIIETNEFQANDTETLRDVIQRLVLPRLWF